VVSSGVDIDGLVKVPTVGSMSTTLKDRSNGDHMLFDLQGLFYVASRSLRISPARRQLIAQSFDSGHGGQIHDQHRGNR
jgi:hypothetical protein